MKKLLLSMLAIAAVFATSCEKDADLGTGGETSKVTFNVGTPEIATRAFSDGKTATVLQYAVYNEDGTEYFDKLTSSKTINISTNVDLQLTTGETYTVIFWAAAPNAPYTVDFANKTMTASYAGLSNDENRDAFYAKYTFTVKGTQTETVELKRPFAQLNIGTSDFEAAKDAGFDATQSMVTVADIYDTMNLFNGEVDGKVEATFDWAAIPSGETFPVAGYDYVSMNYLLVAADKEVVEVTFGYGDGTNQKTRTVGSVPVQRNYRTNIYGQLMTSDVDINVEIKPAYDQENGKDLAADALRVAAAVGGKVKLTEDAVLGSTLVVNAGMVIDLNGHTISGSYGKDQGPIIRNNSNLTIINGTVSSTGDNGGSAIMNAGTLTAENVTFNGAPNANGGWPSYTVNNIGKATITDSEITSYHGAVCSYAADAIITMNNTDIDMTGIPGFTSHGIYTYDGGKVVVNGGDIANNSTDQNSTGASVINGNVEVNAGNFTGRIENYYGTPVLKGGSYSVEPKAAFVAAGYAVSERSGKFVVVPAVVADLDNVNAATVVDLTEDVNVTANTTIHTQNATAEITINGNGHSIISSSSSIDDFQWDGGTIPHMSTILSSQNGEKVTVNDLTFAGTMSAVSLGNYVDSSSNWFNTELNNVNVIDTKVVSFSAGISPAVCVYGTAVLNNCNIYGTTLSDLDTNPMWPVYDLAGVNYSKTTVNGGKIGSIYVWNQAELHIENGAEVESIIVRGNMNTTKYGVTIKAGTTVGTIDLSAITNKAKVNFTIEDGATIGKVVANGIEYATIEQFQNAVTASDATEVSDAIANGVSTIVLSAGDYVIPAAAQGKTVTFIGSGNPADVKVAVTKVGVGGENCDYSLDGSNATFKNLTITTNSSTYIGYARCNGTYENCIINGTYTLYGNSVFTDCTFNVSGDVYNVWTWGAPTAVFNNCTFNSDGKALLLYGTANTKLTINDCTFNDNGGLTDLKAAIEIGNDYGKSYELIVNNTTVNGYEINDKGINTGTTLWANKNSMPQDKLNVVVDGVDVY